jgi:predicted  nucleic acid-binding Zn-ribbon protein
MRGVNELKEKLSNLICLQDCDNRIRRIMDKKNEGPLRIKKLEDELNAIEQRFKEESSRFEALRKSRRNIEQETQDLESKIEKSNIRLSNIKSNREYKAVLKEIDDLKKAKFQAEDRALQVMEEIEILEKRCEDNEKDAVELRKKCDEDKKEVMTELKALDKELQSLEKKRDLFCSAVEKELLDKYLFLKERKQGQAVSPVSEAVCQVCRIRIPPQTYNELIKGNALLTCTNCSRIIYWADDEDYKKALSEI